MPMITPINIAQSHIPEKNEELTTEEKAELKCLSGQMMWVASQTRLDISYEMCAMSNTGKHLLKSCMK